MKENRSWETDKSIVARSKSELVCAVYMEFPPGYAFLPCRYACVYGTFLKDSANVQVQISREDISLSFAGQISHHVHQESIHP